MKLVTLDRLSNIASGLFTLALVVLIVVVIGSLWECGPSLCLQDAFCH